MQLATTPPGSALKWWPPFASHRAHRAHGANNRVAGARTSVSAPLGLDRPSIVAKGTRKPWIGKTRVVHRRHTRAIPTVRLFHFLLLHSLGLRPHQTWGLRRGGFGGGVLICGGRFLDWSRRLKAHATKVLPVLLSRCAPPTLPGPIFFPDNRVCRKGS